MVAALLGCRSGEGPLACLDTAWGVALQAAGVDPGHPAAREMVWPVLAAVALVLVVGLVAAVARPPQGFASLLASLSPSGETQAVRQVFLAAMALVYATAFASLYVQLPVSKGLRLSTGRRAMVAPPPNPRALHFGR